jgi:hypothetical protein
LAELDRANNHCFASHRTTHAPLSGATTDLLLSFAIDYSDLRYLFYIYRRVVVAKKKAIGPTGKEIQLFGFWREFCPMTAPLTPLMRTHSKGGLPASRSWTYYSMAPPIKQENLPAMEDCRLRLKNAVNVKLNASAKFKLTAIDALVIAGFEREVAKNPAMINRFYRLLKMSKPKDVADGEPPAPPAWPRLDQQLEAPPAPNPMPPPRPPALGGPLIDSHDKFSRSRILLWAARWRGRRWRQLQR